MNKRSFFLAVLTGCLLLLGLWFFQRIYQHSISTILSEPVVQSKTTTPVGTNTLATLESVVTSSKVFRDKTNSKPQSVRLFKAASYPPRTAEEKAQWEWWDKMDKMDPDFQWKMPIAFYGKVLDQFDQPVAGAEVELNWTTVIGPIPDPQKIIFAAADGCFEITDIQGKGITISVSKDGYLSERDWIQSFEYAAFYQENFHVPDPNNPVLFHLHKLLGAEPMYQFELDKGIAFSGPPVILDVSTGKLAENGDFAFSLVLDGRNEGRPDYTLQLQARNNAGFIMTGERFPFNAPENGYQTAMSIHQKAGETNYNSRQTFHFYAKTHDGKYGVVWFEVNVPGIGDTASCNATIRYNPSGSRNLEFDQNKWINR
jgi:hypothetical protein